MGRRSVPSGIQGYGDEPALARYPMKRPDVARAPAGGACQTTVPLGGGCGTKPWKTSQYPPRPARSRARAVVSPTNGGTRFRSIGAARTRERGIRVEIRGSPALRLTRIGLP